MTSFTVNGQTVAAPENKRLLRFLRDDLGLTSVKDGCSEGACGTCTVLVDGQPRKACALKTDRLEGAQIITLEGFDPAERDLFARAFAESGAVQCGFCIPGMIVCAKALLDANPSPTPEEVRQALRNNICRCTGYKKIEEAVLLAAAVKRGERELHETEGHDLGLSLTRVDAYAKAAGTAQYTDDVAMEGLLFGAALRSEYPRAKVLSIDTIEAKQAPGVAAVLTAEDVPGSLMIGHLFHDYPVLIPAGEITRFRGDALALVAGENEESVRAALSLIKVDYQPLPAVFSPEEAMAEGAPLVHESAGSESNLLTNEWIRHGDADAALARSAHTVTTEFRLSFTEHAFLEPECAVAWPEDEGVHVISGDQGIYQTQKEVALMLDLAPEKVRVEAAMVGGGFGGKEDMSVQHHAALLAWATGKPVKVRLTRAESM
ncbi:MAG: molybdopterin-dependent oxidoreductase, partial [Clostridia bacterium]|nr:molybdopterin-dependent oxidoreductase [Clostridia bacterium]